MKSAHKMSKNMDTASPIHNLNKIRSDLSFMHQKRKKKNKGTRFKIHKITKLSPKLIKLRNIHFK